MDELCAILGVLLLLGLIMMVIGHVMWLGAAAFIRWISGNIKAGAAEFACPRCGSMRPAGQRCLHCGHGAREVRPVQRDEAEVAMQQVRRLQEMGLVDAETCQRLEVAFTRAKVRETTQTPESEAVAAAVALARVHGPPRAAAPPPLPVHEEVALAQVAVLEPPAFAPDEPRASAPRPPREPRRPLSQVLASFMEEKNIRWGELVGALLIIGSSIALVLTFWNEIAQRPALKFTLFTSITAAVFGVGLYMRHRWRLPTTSRGTLLFACILVPLNFLAVVLQSAAPGTVITLGGELASFVLFGWLVWLAGRALTPSAAGALSVGIVGTSICQALVNRFMPGGAAYAMPMAMSLGAAPIAIYWLAIGWTIAAGRREADPSRALTLLTTLGLASFAAVVPLGLLLHRMGNVGEGLTRLAPLLSLAGMPALVAGLTLWRRLEDRALAGLRTAGTAVAIAGAMVMLAGLAAGWPDPAAMLPVALIDFAALTIAAFAFGIPAAHLLGLACLSVAYVLGVQVGLGHVAWHTDAQTLMQALTGAQTGVALVPLVVALLGGAGVLAKLRREEDGSFYAVVAGATAMVSLLLVSLHGLGQVEDHGATWVYAIYAVGALAAAQVMRARAVSWAAAGLLALAVVQGMVYHWQIGDGLADRWLGAMLVYGSILLGVEAVGWRGGMGGPPMPREGDHGLEARATFGMPMRMATGVAGALVVLMAAGPQPAWGVLAGKTFWLAALWLAMAVGQSSRVLFALFQGALTAGVMFAVIAAAGTPIVRPRMLQLQGVALAALSLAWVGARLGLARFSPLLRTRWSLDRAVTILLAVGVLGLGIWSAAEPIGRELADTIERVTPTDLDAAARAPLAWAYLGLAVLALLLQQRERFAYVRLGAIFLALAGGTLLLAGHFEAVNATASAWRWLCAVFLAVGSIVLWLVAQKTGEHRFARPLATAILLALTIGPIIAITSHSAAIALDGGSIAGPLVGTLFARMGDSINYLAPLGVMMLVLIGFAVRERSAGFAFSAAMTLNYAVSLGYPLWLIARDMALGPVQMVTLIQLNVLAAGLFACGWFAAGHRKDRTSPTLLVLLAGLAVAAIALVQARGIEQVIFDTFLIPAWALQTGSVLGGFAWLAAGSAAALLTIQQYGRLPVGAIFGAIVAGVCLAATRAAGMDGWLGLHMLVAGLAMGSWLILAIGWVERALREDEEHAGVFPAASITRWACVLGGMVLLLSLHLHGSDDPHQPWWAIGGLGAVSLLGVGLSLWTLRTGWLYPAGILLHLCAGLWWNHHFSSAPRPIFWTYTQSHIMILAGCGVAFLLLELFALRPMRQQAVRVGMPAYHHPAAILSGLMLAALTGITLLAHFAGSGVKPDPRFTWGSIATVAVLAVACLWDPRARYAVGGLYLTGLVAALTALDAFALPNHQVIWIGAILLATCSLLAGFAFTQRASLAAIAGRAGIPPRENWPAHGSGWLAAVTLLQTLVVILAAGWTIDTQPQLFVRLGAACAVIAMAVSLGMLASVRGWRIAAGGHMRELALLVGALGVVLWAWAWLEPTQWRMLLLNRIVVTMTALAGMTAFYAIGMVKLLNRENDWTAAARRLVPLLGGATGAALVAILLSEALLHDATLVATTRRAVPMAWWAIGAVGGTLVLLSMTGIACAAVPGRDPLDLPERTRTLYVYGAEFMLVLLFVHVKLCVPDLLNIGIWNRYWPAILMLLAFTGVGLSELFRRQNRPVLAEPLENSAAFLPLLPVAAYWLLDGTWAHAKYIPYPSVLLVAGIVYGTLAFLRRSFLFGLLAALSANGALWWLLHHTERFGFLQHPQLWLIPAALSVLAAAQLNRDRLGEQRLKTVRYLCLIVIYASSTADIWINGVEQSPGLAIVLAGLSVLGVLGGIALRVQSFLLLGTTFLLVSITTMVYFATLRLHANWPWYAALLVLGIAIVVIFALFEKKREEMLRLVEGLRQWEG